MLVNDTLQAIWYVLIFFFNGGFLSGRDAEAEMTAVPRGRNCADWERLSEPSDPDLDHILTRKCSATRSLAAAAVWLC